MKYELSICIPTYNRWECLQELLDSIIGQVDCQTPVEICISDDASTDNTPIFVKEYKKKYAHLVYYRFSENVGLDQNTLKVVSLAHGDYCWLLGNDDKVEPGAIKMITDSVREYKEITALNLNGYMYDSQLKERLYPRILRGLKKSTLQHNRMFDNIEDIVSLFGDSFGFIGENVIRRTLWNEVVLNSDLSPYYGYCYMHIVVLLLMLKVSPRFLYIHQQCVGYRGNNDGFLEILGQIKRLRLDVVAYNQIAEGIFSRRSHIYRKWMSRIVQFHIYNRMRGIKLCVNGGSLREVAMLAFKQYGNLPVFWIYILPLLLIPRRILLSLRSLYRAAVKKNMPNH